MHYGFHSVAVVLTLVTNKNKYIYPKIQSTLQTSTHITKTPTPLSEHPRITKPTHTHTHTLQNPHIHTHAPTHYKTHTYTQPHIGYWKISFRITKCRKRIIVLFYSNSPCNFTFLFSPFRHQFMAVYVYSFRSAFHSEVFLKRTTNTPYLFCACDICIPCKRNRAQNGEPAITFCNDQWIIYVR